MTEPLVRLHPDDREWLAQRVAQLVLEQSTTPPIVTSRALLTPAEVADRFGLSRAWVYDHQELLGVVRLGDGPRPRLRFDPARVAAALEAPSDGALPAPEPAPRGPHRRRRAASVSAALLPIRGPRG